MPQFFHFPDAVKRDTAFEAWIKEHSDELGAISQHRFEVLRDCEDDVRENLHDGHPTACVGDAAFAYVNTMKAHVNTAALTKLIETACADINERLKTKKPVREEGKLYT